MSTGSRRQCVAEQLPDSTCHPLIRRQMHIHDYLAAIRLDTYGKGLLHMHVTECCNWLFDLVLPRC